MKISELTKELEYIDIYGEDKDIKKITSNTSDVSAGTLFFCIEGFKTDGHLYARKAVENGAVALVISKDVNVDKGITKIFVKDTRRAMAHIASNFYNNPSKKIKMVGITGTNGKTTSTFMLKSILYLNKQNIGLLGTIYNIYGADVEEAKRTTPESIDLQRMLYRMNENDVDTCIMEVSSHSLELERTYGIDFNIGIFTNLTQDHLDFHLTMDNYYNAKKKLFDSCKTAVVNIDDEYGRKLKQAVKCRCITYGIDKRADVMAENIIITNEGTSFTLNYNGTAMDIKLKMPGKFNVYNALGCAGAAIELGIPMDIIKEGLEELEAVPGRSEKINSKKGYTVVIDYAHSPDGIINILKTAREYTMGRLITLFGCGGDRDKTKRPLMGKAAGEFSDFCIVTSDNPRSEEPKSIIDDIIPGIKGTMCDYVIIEDRKSAIKRAIELAKSGDVIVIAGKGHETYQVLKDKTIHFDEREIVLEFLKEDTEWKA